MLFLHVILFFDAWKTFDAFCCVLMRNCVQKIHNCCCNHELYEPLYNLEIYVQKYKFLVKKCCRKSNLLFGLLLDLIFGILCLKSNLEPKPKFLKKLRTRANQQLTFGSNDGLCASGFELGLILKLEQNFLGKNWTPELDSQFYLCVDQKLKAPFLIYFLEPKAQVLH